MSDAKTNDIFHGGLARERELLRADFASVLREVCAEDLTHPLGLVFLGQRHGGAAWQAGNCLLLIRRVSPTQTEARLVMYTGAYPDTNAKDCWYALLRCWGDREWLCAPERPPHRRTQGDSPWNGYYCEASHRLPAGLREQLAQRPATDAAEEFFASLRNLAGLTGEEIPPVVTPVPSIGINSSNGRPGRPELDASEKARRLAFGQRAEEIKAECPEMTWKEIYVQLGMPFGEGASGLKKLEYARAQLRRLQEHDPEEALTQVRLYREKHGM